MLASVSRASPRSVLTTRDSRSVRFSSIALVCFRWWPAWWSVKRPVWWPTWWPTWWSTSRPRTVGDPLNLGAGCSTRRRPIVPVASEGPTDVTEALPILLHPVVALLYALTAWLCFPQARQASGAARHVNALVAIALLLHAIGLGRAIFTPTGVDLSFTHALSLVAGLAVLVAWATGLIRALPAVGAVVLPVAAVAAVLPVMGESARRLPYANVPWASVHITIALCAYAILIVAAAEALVLTGIERRLHHALPNPGVPASPPLDAR